MLPDNNVCKFASKMQMKNMHSATDFVNVEGNTLQEKLLNRSTAVQEFQKERIKQLHENVDSVLHYKGCAKWTDEFIKHNIVNIRYLNKPGKTLNNLKFELGLRSYHSKRRVHKQKDTQNKENSNVDG